LEAFTFTFLGYPYVRNVRT